MALSTFQVVQSGSRTTLAIYGLPLLTLPTSTSPQTPTSVLLSPSPHPTTIVISASPSGVSIFISLFCISSVVALSTLQLDPSGLQATIIVSGSPPPFPMTSKLLSTPTSSSLPSTPHPPLIATPDSPSGSIFITLHYISSVVAISTFHIAHSGQQASLATLGHPLFFQLILVIPSPLVFTPPTQPHQTPTFATIASPSNNSSSSLLPCISSVVALLIFPAAHSSPPVEKVASGLLHPCQTPTTTHPIWPSMIPQPPLAPAGHHALLASPSFFITILSISSVVAISLFDTAPCKAQETIASFIPPLAFPPTQITISVYILALSAPSLLITLSAITAPPSPPHSSP